MFDRMEITGDKQAAGLSDADFRPVDEGARDGVVYLVRRGSDYAAAYWTGDMWAYPDTVHQIDFDPTEYQATGGNPPGD